MVGDHFHTVRSVIMIIQVPLLLEKASAFAIQYHLLLSMLCGLQLSLMLEYKKVSKFEYLQNYYCCCTVFRCMCIWKAVHKRYTIHSSFFSYLWYANNHADNMLPMEDLQKTPEKLQC